MKDTITNTKASFYDMNGISYLCMDLYQLNNEWVEN